MIAMTKGKGSPERNAGRSDLSSASDSGWPPPRMKRRIRPRELSGWRGEDGAGRGTGMSGPYLLASMGVTGESGSRWMTAAAT